MIAIRITIGIWKYIWKYLFPGFTNTMVCFSWFAGSWPFMAEGWGKKGMLYFRVLKEAMLSTASNVSLKKFRFGELLL